MRTHSNKRKVEELLRHAITLIKDYRDNEVDINIDHICNISMILKDLDIYHSKFELILQEETRNYYTQKAK